MKAVSKRIVVVGGGAGGLELVTKLGRRFRRQPDVQISLVDKYNSHLWKPLLHEVAAGSLDADADELSYRSHAKRCGFTFHLGELTQVDHANRRIHLAALWDDQQRPILAQRTLEYDILVLAIGSVTHDFGIAGVREHCFFLDSSAQAERFHQRLLNHFLTLEQRLQSDASAMLTIAIVGAGATGVELSAELYHAIESVRSYGMHSLQPKHLQVRLIEAGERILPALPVRISQKVHHELESLGVTIQTQTVIAQADAQGLKTREGDVIIADLTLWAAGVKAADCLSTIDGVAHNQRNQILVKPTLQAQQHEHLFVIGDAAACPLPDGGWVPPRAQSAHQMASVAYRNILAQLQGKPLQAYRYRDYGSLVSLSRYSTVGSLMGGITRGSLFVEGSLARLMYISLYRMHQIALHGYLKTLLLTVVDRLHHILKPRLKLH